MSVPSGGNTQPTYSSLLQTQTGTKWSKASKIGVTVAAVGAVAAAAAAGYHGFAVFSKAASSTDHVSQSAIVTLDEDTVLKCSKLELEGYFTSGCEAVSENGSCLVGCPDSYQGRSVQAFCFPELAKAGKPPAALYLPVCRPEGQAFANGREMTLAWDEGGCLTCAIGAECVATTQESDCNKFTPDLDLNVMRTGDRCLHLKRGPKLRIHMCTDNNANQMWKPTWDGSEVCSAGQKPMCLRPWLALKKRSAKLTSNDLKPALEALKSKDANAFKKEALALQYCQAKLQSGAPDKFWKWLDKQEPEFRKALFSTFPVEPGQVKLLSDIVDMVGEDAFESEGIAPFAIALSFLNRWQDIDELTLRPTLQYASQKIYLEKERSRVADLMESGEGYTGIQSNECKDLHKCCGVPSEWKFKYPRDGSPSVRDWVQWWRATTAKRGKDLWVNPVNSTPWTFALYLWPNPVSECEWVHSKVIDNETMEGKWYLYDSGFHENICKGGDYAQDSLQGIATYGGVCGRMSYLTRSKASCMGQPATQVGQPAHSAAIGFRVDTLGIETALSASILTGADECLVCKGNKCAVGLASESLKCTDFFYEFDRQVVRVLHKLDTCLRSTRGFKKIRLGPCDTQSQYVKATLGDGVFNLGSIELRPAFGKPMPRESAPWRVQTMQFVQCTKDHCHFKSLTDNLDGASDKLAVPTHVEGFYAAAEAYNNFESKGVWPVAHDEARLAATLGVAAQKAGMPTEDAKAAIAWALERNPAVYGIWQAAAQYPGLEDLRSARASMKSRAWFNGLIDSKNSETRLNETDLTGRRLRGGLGGEFDIQERERRAAHAEHFAVNYLLSDRHRAHWAKNPALHRDITLALCPAFGDQTLSLLEGKAGETCRRTRRLLDANAPAEATQLVADAVASESASGNNLIPDAFQDMHDALVGMVAQGSSFENKATAQEVVRQLVDKLHVGYINDESESFFVEHSRVILKSTYRSILELAGVTLTQPERESIFNNTKEILFNPTENAERIATAASSDAAYKDWFLEWVSTHTEFLQQHSGLHSELVVGDAIDGFLQGDDASREIYEALMRDMDQQAESDQPDGQPLPIDELLATLLQLPGGVPPEDADAGNRRRRLAEDNVDVDEAHAHSHDDGTCLIDMCVSDLQSRVDGSFWG